MAEVQEDPPAIVHTDPGSPGDRTPIVLHCEYALLGTLLRSEQAAMVLAAVTDEDFADPWVRRAVGLAREVVSEGSVPVASVLLARLTTEGGLHQYRLMVGLVVDAWWAGPPPIAAGSLVVAVLEAAYRRAARCWADRVRQASNGPLDVLDQVVGDRILRGQDTLNTHAFALAAEQKFTKVTAYSLVRMARLALAVRDADGEDLVPADALDDLPRFGQWTGEVLRRAGMLSARRIHREIKARNPIVARSCIDCDCWGVHPQPRCSSCQGWRFRSGHPLGTCVRCRRTGSPVRADRLCRACSLQLAKHGPDTTSQAATQLWLGGEFALKLQRRAGYLGADVPGYVARQRAAAHRPPRTSVSPHLVDPRQTELFEVRRDWSCITVGSLDQLPALTPAAEALMAELDRYARGRRWEGALRSLAGRSLRIVLAWVGADAPIHEADIRSLPVDRPGTNASRAVQFLAEHGLLIPDPDRQVDVHERVVEQRIQALPDSIAAGSTYYGVRAGGHIQRGRSRPSANTSATPTPSCSTGDPNMTVSGRSPRSTSTAR